MNSREEEAARFSEEIKQYKFKLSDAEVQDYANIASLLNNPVIVTNILHGLEKKLADKAVEINKERTLEGKQDLELKLFSTKSKDEDKGRYKLLSDVLYKWAIDNKVVPVNKDGSATFAKYNNTIDEHVFLKNLSQGLFFKDRGAPRAHGAFTHIIQWYIIVEYFKAAENLKTLHQSPESLYRLLGEKKCISEDGKMSLWFLLMDRNVDKKNPHDLRAVDSMNAFIRDDKTGQFKYLTATLNKVYPGRAPLPGKKPIDTVEMISRKPK